ncbi:hypothetical protein [Allochromatium palmeri]|uniref:Translation initiation factor IF-2 n=1 Tax=Allochromatium palmeri TaxID=231048 RepID=A0A6N8EFI7_9GAMM|nr:hypothetical protein [Allochromatium palmeri]MTW21307.1 hypothetical protein [Allochromatium palmeri]
MRHSVWSFWKRAGLAALVLGPTLAFIAVDAEARRGGGGPGVRAPRGNIGGGHAMRPPGGGGGMRPARPAGGRSGARPPQPGGGGGLAGRPPAGGSGGPRPPAGRPPLAGPPPGGPRPPPPRPRPPIDPYWGAPLGAAAFAAGTALAIGAIVYSLPPNCRTVVVYGESYRQCGSDYYMPRYEGSSVVYELVPSPY